MAISSVGATSRDYVDLDAWIADLPATYTEDETAELYNDSEFVSSSNITLSGINPDGFSTTIKAATGEGFNTTEQALRYNASNGVGIRKSTAFGQVITISIADVTIENLQFSSTGTGNTVGLGTTAGVTVIDCIIESASDANAVTCSSISPTFINTLIISNDGSALGARGVNCSYVKVNLFNCTIIGRFTGSTANGINKSGSAANTSVVKNCAIFGFGTAMESGAWGAGTDFNATDDSTLPVGSNNLTSLTEADQFENIASSATLDLRLKAGNDLDGAGTPDSTNTNDLDIFDNSRSLTTPSIGAYETAGGGVTVTGATANYSYTGVVGTVDLTGEILVTGSTANYDYTGITATIDLTGEVIVTGSTANYDYTALNGTIELGAEIIVVGQTANYDYAGVDGTIDLTALITVTGQTANYDYSGIPADIALQGSIIITGSTANYDYNALNGTIILQGPIVFNPKNIIQVKRKSNSIIVKRKSNTIQVR